MQRCIEVYGALFMQTVALTCNVLRYAPVAIGINDTQQLILLVDQVAIGCACFETGRFTVHPADHFRIQLSHISGSQHSRTVEPLEEVAHIRSSESRVAKECVSTCKSKW